VFSDPRRDPRGHTVTVAYLCEPKTETEHPKAQDDAASLEIVPIERVTSLKLAFDHMEIIKTSGILNNFN
jgi:8-oxo-dGTP diphosphatase